MTDDLVKRLRDKVEVSRIYDDDEELLDEAANRIEKLEAALREIIGTLEDPAGGQHMSDMFYASAIACKALEVKDD